MLKGTISTVQLSQIKTDECVDSKSVNSVESKSAVILHLS